MARSTLILPVESQARELEAKLLLACVAAERGFPVVLGSRAFVHHAVASLPRGVYLAKSMRALSVRMFDILRRLGHEIVAWDEEGLVRYETPDYYRRRLSPRTLGQVSILFTWGEDDAEVLRGYPGGRTAPIHVTGNPRIDLLRPELRGLFAAEVEHLRQRFGSFVLVNTNFGLVNAFAPRLNLIPPGSGAAPARIRPGANAAGMTPEFAAGLAAHKQALFAHFQELLPALAESLPDHAIVLRPHPAEDHAPWRDAARGSGNVHVVNEGSATPWLMAASLLVHNGCTTAVEAAVLGTPALAYRPITAERFDLRLPNLLSHGAADQGELLKKARAILHGELSAPGPQDRQRAILRRHIAALDGPLAADRIVDVLEAAGYAARPPAPPAWSLRLHGWTHLKLRTLVKRINTRRPGHRNSAAFHRHRFPGVGLGELRSRVECLQGSLGRFAGLEVRRLSEHVFQIER